MRSVFRWLFWALLSFETRKILVKSFAYSNHHHGNSYFLSDHVRRSTRSFLSLLSLYSSSPELDTTTSISFEQLLQQYVRQNDTASVMTVEGIVVAKRSLGKQLVFCDLHIQQSTKKNNDDSFQDVLTHALLKRDYYLMHNHPSNRNTTTTTTTTRPNNNDDSSYYEGYRRCLLPGTTVRVTGTAAATNNPGKVVLLLQSIQIRQLPRQIQHITTILQQCRKGNLPWEEIMQASGGLGSVWHERWNAILTKAEPQENNNPLGPTTEAATTYLLRQLAQDMHDQLPAVKKKQPIAATRTKRTNRYALPEAPDEVRELNVSSQHQPTTMTVSGWVQNRQRFQDSITLFTITHFINNDENSTTKEQRLTCLLHPHLLQQQQDAGVYCNLLAAGAQVQMDGYFLQDNNKNHTQTNIADTFVAQQIRLLQSSDRPETIRFLLEILANEEVMDRKEAAHALRISDEEATRIAQSSDATERQWKANQLSAHLQQQMKQRHSTRLDPSLLRPLEKYRPVAQKYPVQFVGRNETISSMPFLRTGLAGSRWMSQKRPQLEWMCQQIRSVLESHPDYQKRKLSILDIGGGQGFLANALGQAMMEDMMIEHIHVVDICARAIHNGATRAQQWGTPVVFEVADASRALHHTADVVVALHACGHLSDVALVHAVQRQAGFVIVPCCFRSNPHLTLPTNDNETHVEDWLGIPSEDWLALKHLAEVQGNIRLATRAMEVICAVRADAVQNKWKQNLDGDGKQRTLKVSIRQFPLEYSTRNTVLVGSFA